MFPPDALPLPPKPSLERYKKLAKDLTRACRAANAGNSNAIGAWSEKWMKALGSLAGMDIDSDQIRRRIDRKIDQIEKFATNQLTGKISRCRLSEAQFVIARCHGFESWPKFAQHLLALADKTSSTARFEAAIEAIVDGDLKKLKNLLKQDPKLVRMRSAREHRSTLLHYVGANGVEGYRQKTPKNAAEIAELLLERGAEVNAEANLYGGGATPLGLAATSVHPFVAGVQNPLLEVLIEHGADIDHQTGAGNKQYAVLGCLANGRKDAAVYLAQRGAKLTLEGAAGVGRLDIVKSAFREDGRPKAGVTKKEIVSAFLYTCAGGQNHVVRFFLDKGMNPMVHRGDGQTALHWAVIGGQLETLKLLLEVKPSLEEKNMYGGTVLGQALWSAAHGGDPKVHRQIIETLIDAGAKLRERHVPVNKEIDDLLRQYGSEPEPSWYWFGEGPGKSRLND